MSPIDPQKLLEDAQNVFFTHSLDLLAVVGTDGYFKRVNPAFERTLGYPEHEFYAKPLAEFLHPDDVSGTKKGIDILATGVHRISSVNRYRLKDGTYRWFSWTTTPIGSLLYTIGRDITEQVGAEQSIRQLNLQLEQKNETLEQKVEERLAELRRSEAQVQQLQKMDAVGRLAGGIAHDFNNMLGAMSMYSDLLWDEAQNPESVRKTTQELREAIARAASLTRQLLVFSRKQVIHPEPINLNPLIQQLEKMLIRLIGESVKIVTKCSQDLKFVSVDPSQMEQVVLNLVVNARDAMPNGGIINVETSNVYLDQEFSNTHLSVSRGHYVLLSVSDNGVGMDAATMAQIFDPFFTTKPAGKGTGLGLTTTYGIIKQSKGTIWVYSEPGKGTVFKIYLPVVEAVFAEPEITKPKELDRPGTQTILLVEDDPSLRTGFSLMLQKRGYQVLAAESGAEALEICRRHDGAIHLLLTDMVMSGLSGLELAKEAVVLRGDLRVLYMSGFTSDALENAGVDNLEEIQFIQKPFGTSALVKKIQEVLS